MTNTLTSIPLPIDSIIPELKQVVSSAANVVLKAPPGAGKTTRVPLALLDLPVLNTGRIIMLEPRRLAASHAAHRMARSLGEAVGQTVGYTIRFDRRVSPGTRIEVVTEGVLTRRLQKDPCLEDISMIIFDEFHERSLHADLALALCLEVQREVRTDLRLLVMSATLDCIPVSELLGGAPVIASEGKSFSVEVKYLENMGRTPFPAQMLSAIRTAMSESEGDILAFLPGSPEIRTCAQLLLREIGEQSLSICPLYGDMPFNDQEKAIAPSRKRKIVLATNIAETSLTIEGVRTVVDSGLSRTLRHDPANGMNRLVTVRESKASAEQRRGRAGRLAPGACYRLFGRHTFDAMTDFSPPEIAVSDLSSLVLELAVWGVVDPASLNWLDPPRENGVTAARELLVDLGAIDRNGLPTVIGRKMAEFPVHPRLARMLLRGMETGFAEAAACIAALLSERDIFRYGPGESATVCESDLLERYEALHGHRGMNCGRLQETALKAVERSAAQLARLAGCNAGKRTAGHVPDHLDLARLLLAAYPDRIARRREEGGDRYLLATGRGARLSPRSGVRNRELILAVHVDAGEKGEGVIHQACAITEDLVRFECGHLIAKKKNIAWEPEQERVLAREEETIGSVAVVRRQAIPTDEEAIPVLLDVIRSSSLQYLDWCRSLRMFLGRARLMRKVFPEGNWPDTCNERLLAELPEWLGPFLAGARSRRDLISLDLSSAVRNLFTWEQLRLLDELAPTHVSVPSGHRIEIDYEVEEGPVLAVKLQEMFGLADSPVVAGGRVRLLLHLLSPAGRPVQVTRDLKGFWENGYLEVKKELKGRYPKHPWPDDPWNAAPTRMTNRMLKK
jgi:ATP-dependent helicase HrpB